MADILPFKKPAGKRPASNRVPGKNSAADVKSAGKGKTLCANGHHKWEVSNDKQFDSKQGKLVTLFRCSRCGKQKVKAL